MRLRKVSIWLVAVLALAANCVGQGTNFQIISASVNKEKAIRVEWKSESNAVYRIEYAAVLVNSNTVWALLFDDYPSHGTNTFWLDVGDYVQDPPIKRPQDNPLRFYRIAKTGTNTAAPPFVIITSPGNGSVAAGELTVSVIATSSLPVLDIALFVDGQEMPASEDGTNFVINTSEWANGPHILFATAKGASRFVGFPGFFEVTYGRAVSPYVSVTFSNYISEFSFSEPFFEPSLGQTQSVTTVFAAYSDWTLQVLDESDNPVRTVTGSGRTAQFDWDGTGDGGVSLPDGIYRYLMTATEATEPSPAPGGGGGGGGSPPSPSMAAMTAGEISYLVQPPPMPPVRQNGKWFTWEEIFGPLPPVEVEISGKAQEAFLQSLTANNKQVMASGATAMMAGASAKAPTKPPIKPVKGSLGSFGLAYYTYPSGLTNQRPPNGLGGSVQLDGGSLPNSIFMPVAEFKSAAQAFAKVMTGGGWKVGFHKYDTDLTKADLMRDDSGYTGSNIFRHVNIGLFMSHGNFGSSLDFNPYASQSFQTYFALGGSNPPNSWVALSEFNFRGNLRWMAVLACNSLRDDNYQSMLNKFVLPIGDGLHLLLGCSTYAAVNQAMGERWGKNLVGGAFAAPQTIQDAWINAGKKAYALAPVGALTNQIRFKVSGWDVCFGDKLRSYVDPDPEADTIQDVDVQVYP